MATICDRSPCDSLLHALGKYVFGVYGPQKGSAKFTLEVLTAREGTETAVIMYCPFCGTRLEEIGPALLEKFLPKKRS